MKKLLLLAIMLLGLGGVIFAQSPEKKPVLLLNNSGELSTEDFDITPLPGSTLEKTNLYGATFTPKDNKFFKNVFQYKPYNVGNYRKIVVVFGEAVADGWNINGTIDGGSKFVSLKGKTSFEMTVDGTVEDFTIFNWDGCTAPITISEVYLTDPKPVDTSNHYLKISTNEKKTNPWEWAIKYKLDASLETDKTYTLSMLAKSTSKINPDNGNIWFWPSGSDGKTTYTGYPIGTEWGKCTCEFKASGNHEFLIWNFGPFEGDIYFDDITLVEKGQSTNLMEDDFEDGLSSKWCDDGWNKPVYKVVSEKEDIDRQPINIVAKDKNFSVWSKEYPKNTSSQVSADGEGVYAVKAVAKVSNTWDTQVWISASQDLPVGSLYTIEFACKASEAVKARAQIHGKADGNNYRYDLEDKDFPTDWTTYKIEGKIKDNRGGKSLAFNLSQEEKDVTYYFKDIKVTVTVDENTATAINGNTTITIGEKGSRTYCSNHALDFSGVDGLKAYVASAFDPNHSNVTMTEVTKVPANTGLYLVGTAGDYNVPVASEAATIGTNMLVGISSTESDYVEATEGEYVNLVLATTAAGRGFHPLSKSGKMGNNKAYLHVTSTDFAKLPSEAPLRITIEDEEATGIEEVATPIVADGVWYTINGVKLAGEPTEKGIYIFNGKKVAIQ